MDILATSDEISKTVDFEADYKRPAMSLPTYQARWVAAVARFLIACFARQTGKSFGSTLKIAASMLRGNSWLLLSAGQRQSRELIFTLSLHLHAMQYACAVMAGKEEADDGTKYQVLEIELPNGARATALAANPLTARGWSRNVYFDEHAWLRDGYGLWAAVFPSITRGYRVMMTSTFDGKENHFYHTWSRKTGPWERHRADIYEAVAQGLVLRNPETAEECTPEELREALNDEAIWAEEYLLQPKDGQASFITHEMITACQDLDAPRTPSWVPILLDAARTAHEKYRLGDHDIPNLSYLVDIPDEGPDIVIGHDVARTQHFSVIQVSEGTLGDQSLRPVATIDMRDEPFWIQERLIDAIAHHPRFTFGAIDSTGLGMQMAEGAQDRHGHQKFEAVNMSGTRRDDVFMGLYRAMDDRRITLPDCDLIRASLRAVRKTTERGNVKLSIPSSSKLGHGDHFCAFALAEYARSRRGDEPRFEMYSRSMGSGLRHRRPAYEEMTL